MVDWYNLTVLVRFQVWPHIVMHIFFRYVSSSSFVSEEKSYLPKSMLLGQLYKDCFTACDMLHSDAVLHSHLKQYLPEHITEFLIAPTDCAVKLLCSLKIQK